MALRWTRARARAPRETLRAVGALLALSVSAFCYVTTENLPIGLLKVISADLRVSLSAVGLLVTGYGATVAIASVPLTYWTRLVPRRWLLSGLLVVFVLATVMSVATSSYAVLLAARVTTALSQALFWAVAATTATGLFSPRSAGSRPRRSARSCCCPGWPASAAPSPPASWPAAARGPP
jgi:predicted MFS family arabinose efflux permease